MEGRDFMKKFLMFLILICTFGISTTLNAADPCKNCKKSDYSHHSKGIGKNGVANASKIGSQKLSHSRLSHNHKNI